jgi:hypothetical protein
MSTPTPTRPAAPARPAVVPQPRPAAEQAAAEPAVVTPAEAERVPTPSRAGERPGLFERSAWLIPVGGIACVVAVFVAMVLLTWIAGGNTPFDR